MIEDKLEEAQLRSARKRMQIVIAVLATICAVGVLVFGLSLIDFASKDTPLPVSNPLKNETQTDRERLRTTFIENLQQYENELEPRMETAGLEIWNRDGRFEITEIKKEVMSYFSSGEYDKALAHLQLLKNRTVTIVDEADQLFQEHVEKAASFLAEDLYDEAKLHIDKALVISSQSSKALALKEQIEKLPFLLPLLDGARIARAENNFSKERDFLQQVVAMAPDREEETARLEVLAKLIKQQNFEAHVSSGFDAVLKKQIKEARYHYQEARKIDPQRAELSMLSNQISTLERTLRTQRYIKQAKQAVAQDDWHQAKENFAKAAQDEPDNKVVAEGLQQAEGVVDLLDRLTKHIENPYRLIITPVREDAEQVLRDAENVSGLSLAVRRKADSLKEMIATVNRPVPVTIISDNQTFIQVRSVGKVGLVLEKTIELKPGKYTFEGTRDGYKAKLVQAFISYDMEKYSLRIVCDEQI